MPHLHRTVPGEREGRAEIDGGFGQITNEARRSIKQINETVHGWAVYSYGVTTTWALTGQELADRLGISRDAARAALRHLVRLGWVVRAEWRDGQRNQYGYLFLGHRLEIDVDEAPDGEIVRTLEPGSAWNGQVARELHKAFPSARSTTVLGATRNVSEHDRSEDMDLRALSGGSSSEGPQDGATSTYKTLSPHDADGTTHDQSVTQSVASLPPSFPPARADERRRFGQGVPPVQDEPTPAPRGPAQVNRPAALAQSPREVRVMVEPDSTSDRLARAALAHYARQIERANAADGGSRWKPGRSLLPLLAEHAARQTVTDLRDALDYAVHGDGTEHGPPLARTASLAGLTGWMHRHMADKDSYDHLEPDGAEFWLDVKLRDEGRMPTYDEAPSPLPALEASAT